MFLTKDRAITQKAVRALFVKSYITRRRELIYPKFVETIDSYVYRDFAATFGTVPQLEEVPDDVTSTPATGFRDYKWEWTNRLYQAVVSMNRSIIDFDQTGQSRKVLSSLAARLANLPDAILAARIRSDTLYSGEWSGGTQIALWATTHLAPLNSSTAQSNKLTGSTTTAFVNNNSLATVALQIQQDWRKVKAAIRGFKDDQGQPWHNDSLSAESFTILCSPLMEEPMRMAFFSDNIGATRNTLQGAVKEVVVSNYLPSASGNADAADWRVFITNELNRPLVFSRFRHIRDEEIQDNEALPGDLSEAGASIEDLRSLSSVKLQTNLTHQGMNAESDVILNRRFLMSAEWRGEILGGEWRNTVMVDNTD